VSTGWLVIKGETHVTLAAAAECYAVRVEWVREVFELGLLGPGEVVEDAGGEAVAVVAAALDRLAEIIRLHRHHGMDMDEVERFLALLRARAV
jgi:hypothetical protein